MDPNCPDLKRQGEIVEEALRRQAEIRAEIARVYRLTLEEVDLIIRVINNIRDLTLRAKLAGAASALVRQLVELLLGMGFFTTMPLDQHGRPDIWKADTIGFREAAARLLSRLVRKRKRVPLDTAKELIRRGRVQIGGVVVRDPSHFVTRAEEAGLRIGVDPYENVRRPASAFVVASRHRRERRRWAEVVRRYGQYGP